MFRDSVLKDDVTVICSTVCTVFLGMQDGDSIVLSTIHGSAFNNFGGHAKVKIKFEVEKLNPVAERYLIPYLRRMPPDPIIFRCPDSEGFLS